MSGVALLALLLGGGMRVVALLALLVLAVACSAPPLDPALAGADASRGKDALRRYGCGGCHVVPGLPETRGAVGPPLAGLADRAYIAGRLTNQPMNLTRWIRAPRSVDPGTLMPDLGVSEQDARDIAAYLHRAAPPTARAGPRWPPVGGTREGAKRP